MADLFLIPYVRSVWRMLGCRLGTTGRMAVFGAGAHTRWLLSVTADLPRLPIECIIDDRPEAASVAGLEVRRPDKVSVESLDLILISSDRWEEELADRARGLWGDRVELVRLYEGLPCGPYDKTDDHSEALRRVQALSARRPAASRLVVIVSDQPRSREAKIGYALRRAGWRPVLLHRRAPTFDTSRFFESVRTFNHEWEALRLACDYSPVAYHIMVNSDYRVASLFVCYRPGVIVIDSYDLVAGMYTDAFLAVHQDFGHEIARERYCLEQADGICSRSREPDVLEGEWGYRLAPRVFLPDGCWNMTPAVQARRVDGLHIVYVGKLHRGRRFGERFAACGCNLALARAVVDQGLHLHVYPSPGQLEGAWKGAFAEYRELQRVSPRFHLHRPLPPDRLVEALAQCDLAMSVYPERVAPTGTPSGFRPEKLRHCTTNKFFDYIDAGLPILHNADSDSHLSSILDRHGIGIDVGAWPIREWAERLREIDPAEMRARVIQARADYDVRRHVGLLIGFYERLRTARAVEEERQLAQSEELPHADSGSECRQALV